MGMNIDPETIVRAKKLWKSRVEPTDKSRFKHISTKIALARFFYSVRMTWWPNDLLIKFLHPRMPVELEKKMTNCPRCNKPILNGGSFTSHAKFTIRCPWCQATLEINVQPKIITEVIKLGNGTNSGDFEIRTPQSSEKREFEKLFEHSQTHAYRLIGYLYPEKREWAKSLKRP